MKKTVITVLALFLSFSYCAGQSIKDDIEKQKQQQQQEQRAAEQRRQREREAAEAQKLFEEQQRQEAEKQRLEAEKQKQREEIELKAAEAVKQRERYAKYQGLLTSAERNFARQQYESAIKDYTAALEIMPENAETINRKLQEIEKKMNEPALLHIYRKRFSDGLMTSEKYDVLLNNMVVGKVAGNWKTTVSVTTFGSQKVSASIGGRKAEVSIYFESGGVYYIRAGITSRTINTGKYRTSTDKNGRTTRTEITESEYTPTLQLVDKSVGESEFKSIK